MLCCLIFFFYHNVTWKRLLPNIDNKLNIIKKNLIVPINMRITNNDEQISENLKKTKQKKTHENKLTK